MTQRKKRQKNAEPFLGFRFDSVRTRETSGDKSLLLDNHLNFSVSAGSTHYDALKSMARLAPRPFPVKFISEQLKGTVLPRACTYFGEVWDAIDITVSDYPKIGWWMTAEGLVVDEVPPELESLSEFERIVGSTFAGKRITKEALQEVAKELDSAGIGLLDQLQPQEKDEIASKNRKRQAKKICNFATAVADPIAKRFVLRAIYRAREKYVLALAMSGN